ncbi:MAG: SPOR domain-containing protein [Proteobacteria bacterium]|nr:SPOR domain-containing protein [Pseudomonadota bacterium]
MRDRKKIKARHYFELDNRQMIFVFAGFIVVCLFVFTAGLMVGSKMTAEKEASVKPESELRAKIKAPSLLVEDKKEKKVEAGTKPAPAKTIEEILEQELKKGSSPEKENRSKVKTKAVAKPVHVPAPTPTKQTSLPAKEEAFFVQVASFQKSEDADRQAARLKSKGYKVVIVKADIPGKGTWYRVRLGPYKDSADAKTVALKYEKSEKSTTFITKGLI